MLAKRSSGVGSEEVVVGIEEDGIAVVMVVM